MEGLPPSWIDSPSPCRLAGAGIAVRVPDPARFALHKLFVAAERPASETGRVRQDRLQAATRLRLLRDDRPGSIDIALEALGRSSRPARRVRRELERLELGER